MKANTGSYSRGGLYPPRSQTCQQAFVPRSSLSTSKAKIEFRRIPSKFSHFFLPERWGWITSTGKSPYCSTENATYPSRWEWFLEHCCRPQNHVPPRIFSLAALLLLRIEHKLQSNNERRRCRPWTSELSNRRCRSGWCRCHSQWQLESPESVSKAQCGATFSWLPSFSLLDPLLIQISHVTRFFLLLSVMQDHGTVFQLSSDGRGGSSHSYVAL